MRPISVYIHIPFCRTKCLYCDFASVPANHDSVAAYMRALHTDAERQLASLASQGRSLATLYIGGGTPTVVPPADLAALLTVCLNSMPVEPDIEVTVEANPGTVTCDTLARLRDAGANRLSLGVQSLSDDLLQALGRTHTATQAHQAITDAHAVGFSDLSADLIYGIPGQSPDRFEADLRELARRGLPHLSAYALTYEEGTPLRRARDAGRIAPMSEEDEAWCFARAGHVLAEYGLDRYEVSNFARPGAECRHNLTYWRRGEYLGLGAAAHSFIAGRRWWNARQHDDYVRCVTDGVSYQEGSEEITPENAWTEAIMLGLRLREGIALDTLEGPPGGTAEPPIWSKGYSLQQRGLLELADGRLRLTTKGLLVADAVTLELVS